MDDTGILYHKELESGSPKEELNNIEACCRNCLHYSEYKTGPFRIGVCREGTETYCNINKNGLCDNYGEGLI